MTVLMSNYINCDSHNDITGDIITDIIGEVIFDIIGERLPVTVTESGDTGDNIIDDRGNGIIGLRKEIHLLSFCPVTLICVKGAPQGNSISPPLFLGPMPPITGLAQCFLSQVNLTLSNGSFQWILCLNHNVPNGFQRPTRMLSSRRSPTQAFSISLLLWQLL